jgi:hypothetical protein
MLAAFSFTLADTCTRHRTIISFVTGPVNTQPHGLSHIILLFGPVLSRRSYMDSLIMYNTSIKTIDEFLNEFIKVIVKVYMI